MTEKPEIKRLDSASVEKIRELWDHAGLSYRPDGRDDHERLKTKIEQGQEIFWGIFENNDLVGVILATHDGRKGWLNRLAVDPAYRGRGYAKHLIRHAEEHLHREGIEIIAALIEDWNKESLELFQNCGYVLHRDIQYLTKRKHPGV